MIEINIEELSKSEFYSNTELFRHIDKNEKILIMDPRYYIDINDVKNTDIPDNFINLFNTINYWGSNSAPNVFYYYLLYALKEEDIPKMIQIIEESYDDNYILKKEALLILISRLDFFLIFITIW